MSDLEREFLQYVAERSGEVSLDHLARQFSGEPGPDLPTIVQSFIDRGWVRGAGMLGTMPGLVVTAAGARAIEDHTVREAAITSTAMSPAG